MHANRVLPAGADVSILFLSGDFLLLCHTRLVQCQICAARDPEVGWVSWWSIWSCHQFSYSCTWIMVTSANLDK